MPFIVAIPSFVRYHYRDWITSSKCPEKWRKKYTQLPDYDAAWFDQPVIHRIINITDINGTTMYMIKGDNNDSPDPYYVKSSQIKEKVVENIYMFLFCVGSFICAVKKINRCFVYCFIRNFKSAVLQHG